MKIVNAFKDLFKSIDDLPVTSTLGKLLIFLAILALAIGVVFLVWWIEQWLWNTCLATYFHWQDISFWQMAGISVLIGWLFKSPNTKSE